MADIELVIKIDEKLYSDMKSLPFTTFAEDVIIKGTPLPKGHGRLGDLDALREEVSSWGMNDYEPSDFIDEIDRAATIIEAESEDKE